MTVKWQYASVPEREHGIRHESPSYDDVRRPVLLRCLITSPVAASVLVRHLSVVTRIAGHICMCRRERSRGRKINMILCNHSVRLLAWYRLKCLTDNRLGILQNHCSPRATFDPAERFDPPRCAQSTRIGIIEQCINNDGSNTVPASLFWLYGGAGVGKSAIAQTLAEKLHQEKKLAASFFFFRNDALRNNGALIPTLVSQLVSTFRGLGPFVEESIRANPANYTRLKLKTKTLSFLPRPSVKPILSLTSEDALRSRHCPRWMPKPGGPG